MNTEANGAHAAHAVQTRPGHTGPQRPAGRAVVAPEAVEPARPVDGWGFTNRVLIVATLLTVAFVLGRVFLFPDQGAPDRFQDMGDVERALAMGETGMGWVTGVQSMLFGLIGGALAAAAGYLVVLLMGGAARSAARYAIGGLIGGLLAAVGLIFVFSNTVVLSLGMHVFWLLPLAGLLGGLWAGIVSSRR